MLRRLLALSLLSAPWAAAAADTPEADAAAAKDRTRYRYGVRAAAGYFDGTGVRTDSGGIAIIELDLKPILSHGAWDFEIPLRLDHQQTFGADLNETLVGARLEAWNKGDKAMRYGPFASIAYTRRADWPDLYQPDPSNPGALLPTDRFTHLDWVVGWQQWHRLDSGRNLRWKVRVDHQNYEDDPTFDDTDPSPTHVVPKDNYQVKFDSSYRSVHEVVTYGAKLDARYRWDTVDIAREANTGNATTRLARSWDLEPTGFFGFNLGKADLTLEYTWRMHVDAIYGYYSYNAHVPSARIEIPIGQRLSIRGRVEGWFATYNPDSRDRTEDGKRYYSTKVGAKAGARYELSKDLFLVANGEWLKRETNKPDYLPPGVVIDFDYVNVLATAGVEWTP